MDSHLIFIPGDTIRCRDSYNSAAQLLLNKEYKVAEMSASGTTVRVEGSGRFWKTARFEKVYQKPAPPPIPTKALRYNTGKPCWSLVDFASFEPMVEVLEYGAEKYTVREGDAIVVDGRDNWKNGQSVKKTIESLLRHTFALLSGEDIDPESGKPHIGHMEANAMILGYTLKNRPDCDDRAKKTPPDDAPNGTSDYFVSH